MSINIKHLTLTPATFVQSKRLWSNSLKPATVAGKIVGYIALPAISEYVGTAEVSVRFRQFNFIADSPFTVNKFLHPQYGAEQFLPVIRYRQDAVCFRYKLVSDIGELAWSIPEYAGEIILENFSIEYWTIPGESYAFNVPAFNITTSMLQTPGNFSFDETFLVSQIFGNLSASDMNLQTLVVNPGGPWNNN